MGVCSTLGPGDTVFGTHRSHAHAIAKGAYASGVELWAGSVVDAYAPTLKTESSKQT